MIQIINPTSQQHWLELRTKVLTSTDIAALFGISPYLTAFELWHRKKGGYQVEFEPNQRMKLGTALQDAIAEYAGKENGWAIRRMDEFIQNGELRIGSSFDFEMSIVTNPICEKALLEIKNVDYIQFKKEWIELEDGSIEAPLHIEIQCQHQLLVSGRPFLYLAALVGGNDLKLIKRLPDEKIFAAITAKAWDFWQSIEDNKPPEPNFENDAEFISKIYGFAEPGKVISVVDNPSVEFLVAEYRFESDNAKESENKKQAIKAKILTLIGDAEKCIGQGYTISAGIIGGCHVEFDRKPYRSFKVSYKDKK